MKNLYFIRHGESEMNVAQLSSGHTDTPLTKRGHDQAATTGINAKRKNLTIDRVFSSPLQRAHHTAKGVIKHLDFDEDSIELIDLIKERHFGELEGKNLVKNFGVSTDVYYADETSIDHISGIEKLAEMHERAHEALRFFQSLPEKNILVVAHGAFGRALYRAANNLAFDTKVPIIKNAEIIKLL